ncbi:MAG: hypothetical protein KGL90_02790 [Burkholderiales bacterium]|nr:hypothetical protein [Burkholderiales bacterium]
MLAVLRPTSLKACAAMGLIVLASSAYAQEHDHKASERSAATVLNHGKKWETDAVLRQGMDNIAQAMAVNREGIEKERLSPQDYQRLAEVVEKNLADIVKNCKLSKASDAAFHNVVLADMTRDAELMRTSPKVQVQRVSALGVLRTLHNYGEYFQHPAWAL